jgi:tripartite-type tricarboxylate transporter receptor subunit TctC
MQLKQTNETGMRLWVAVACVISLLAAASRPSLAQTAPYPSKPIRLLVGSAPGGAVDAVARTVGARVQKVLGQPFVIENHPGPFTAMKLVSGAAPDGYTLMLASTVVTVNPLLYPKVGIDTSSVAAVAKLTDTPVAMVIRPDLPVSNVAELVKLARAEKKQLTFGSAGVGTASHLAMEIFKNVAEVDLLHVPYKGVAPALVDLAASRLDVMITAYGSVRTFIKANRVRVLAVSNEKRIPDLPEVLTLRELGYPAATFGSWTGIIAPLKTPAAIIEVLSREFMAAVQDATTQQQLIDQGFTPAEANSVEFAALLKSESQAMKALIARAGIVPN